MLMVKLLGNLENTNRSPATIMSFELFKTIGKAANISSNSFLPLDPDFTLVDYSQRTIPIGAKVNLKIG